jgi:hypothetical protein
MVRPPRFRPAAVAGAGAGGSLGAAAFCILVLGTAGVAFKPRAPAGSPAPGGSSVRLDSPPPDRNRAERTAPSPRGTPSLRATRPARVRGAPRREARPRPVLTTRQRRARPVLPAAPPAPVPTPAPAPPPPPPPEPAPTLVRGHAEQAAAEVRDSGQDTPLQPVTELAASTVEAVAKRLP